MTSVVDTSVKHFHHAMVGAPILNGVAGSMISLLNACLVTGFDTKVASSLVVASGVATLSFTGTHSATVDSVVLVSGSSIAALNGEQKVTAIGAGTVKFATAAADGAASGSLSFKMAPAGWLQPFTGTNLAMYKSADPASTAMVLRVDDTGTMMCRVVGYEQATDINTGTGPFPTNTQMAGGGYWSKSSAASTATQQWALFADGRTLILHAAPYAAASVSWPGGVTREFGDALALKPGGDAYGCSLSYSSSATLTSQMEAGLDFGSTAQHAMPRAFTGLGSCVLHSVMSYLGGAGALSGADSPGFGPFPSTVDGGVRLGKKYLAVTNGASPRCDVAGLYGVPMTAVYDAFKTRDILTGAGALAGKKLMALNPTNSFQNPVSNSNTGVSFVDITGPWR